MLGKDTFRPYVSKFTSNPSNNYYYRNITIGFSKIIEDRAMKFYLGFLLVIVLIGIFGPMIAPYDASANLYAEDGTLHRSTPPSLDHPLGTTQQGYDVFSRLLVGTRPTVIAGLLGGTMIISIGLTIGIISGYVGGKTDVVLMRFTDFVYGVPVLPTALVIAAFLGTGFLQSVFIIGVLMWRASARVLRSQVLQIKERPFILASISTGAGTPRILIKHILPNILPMAVLFFALGIGHTIIIQASLAFIGVATPFVPSWGVMIRNAFNSGQIATSWWWGVPPGILLGLTVMCTFMLGRGVESIFKGERDSGEEGDTLAM